MVPKAKGAEPPVPWASVRHEARRSMYGLVHAKGALDACSVIGALGGGSRPETFELLGLARVGHVAA